MDPYLRYRKEADMKRSSRIVVRSVFALIAVISLAGCYQAVTGPDDGGGTLSPRQFPTTQT
jgi:hypothetical protein